jgi:hypothetical protein
MPPVCLFSVPECFLEAKNDLKIPQKPVDGGEKVLLVKFGPVRADVSCDIWVKLCGICADSWRVDSSLGNLSQIHQFMSTTQPHGKKSNLSPHWLLL